jgi:hypothetical protein
LFTDPNAEGLKADANGSVLANVWLESRPNNPWTVLSSYRYFFHLGVSYAKRHLDLQATYNQYYPAQLLSRGAPFTSKRDAVLFLAGNCAVHKRNALVTGLKALLPVEALGSCLHNAGEVM